jgi:hypothetical protein
MFITSQLVGQAMSWRLEKGVDKGCDCSTAGQYDQRTEDEQGQDDWYEPVFSSDFQKPPKVD